MKTVDEKILAVPVDARRCVDPGEIPRECTSAAFQALAPLPTCDFWSVEVPGFRPATS
jgi:hypothetical protein